MAIDITSSLRGEQANQVSFDRPKLLVSVRNAAEAIAALEGGADWIDLKEPFAGALGPVEAKVAKEVVASIAGRLPVSAALGELVQWSDAPAQSLLTIQGIEVVKLGLARCAKLDNWYSDWHSVAEQIKQSKKQLVAVAYADWRQVKAPSPAEVIALAMKSKMRYLLFDTFDKQAGSIVKHLSPEELSSLLQIAKRSKLQTVVAGSLAQANLSRLPAHGIDMVAVRGAVCAGERTHAVEEHLVRDFFNAIELRWPSQSNSAQC